MLLDFAQHQESQLPYNSEEHWMSSFFLISSLWSQPPSAASRSRVVNVSAGANFQGSVLLCSAVSCSTVPNIYCTRLAWQKHTTQQLGVIVSSPSMAILLFITWSWLIVLALACYSTALWERAPRRQSKRPGDPGDLGMLLTNLKTQKGRHLSNCQKSALRKMQGVTSSYLQATCALSPALAIFLNSFAWKYFAAEVSDWAKEAGSEAKEWLLHYAASSHNKGIRFWSACWSLLFLLWYLVVNSLPTSV